MRSIIHRRAFAVRILAGACMGGALLIGAHNPARAQLLDVSPAPPNVLILLDTSGSMEKMIDGSDTEDGNTYAGLSSICAPGTQSEPNRWGVAVQALSGDVQPFYSCLAQTRASGSKFVDEYAIVVGGTRRDPYDKDYHLDYHRPVSTMGGSYAGGPPATVTGGTSCVMGPWTLPGAGAGSTGVGAGTYPTRGDATTGAKADDWITNGLGSFAADATGVTSNKSTGSYDPVTGACPFKQANNGFLDAGRSMVRFGLMTFDTDVGFGTGVDSNNRVATAFLPSSLPSCGGSACAKPLTSVSTPGTGASGAGAPATPFDGMWSYYPGWDGWAVASGSPAYWPRSGSGNNGLPSWGQVDNTPSCPRGQFDVGARNSSAPPWEGRMMRFPAPTAGLRDIQRTNDRVKQVIASARPFGATPLTALLKDAQDYFWNDPTGPERSDPYVNPTVVGGTAGAGCRDQYAILITDGAPNLDLVGEAAGMGPASTFGNTNTAFCEGGAGHNGHCPSGQFSNGKPKRAEDIAWELYKGGTISAYASGTPTVTGSNRRVTTFVIGFAVSGNNANYTDTWPGGATNCSTYAKSATFQSDCADPTTAGIAPGSGAAACCALEKIAQAGQNYNPSANPLANSYAYFADTPNDLKTALSSILGLIASGTTTRAIPVYTPTVLSASTGDAAFDAFFTEFTPSKSLVSASAPDPSHVTPWKGNIKRRRGACGTSTLGTYTAGTSDDYQAVTGFGAGSTRRFVTVAPGTLASGGGVDSMNTMRPFYPASDPDGAGTYAGSEVGTSFAAIDSAVPAGALNITAASCGGTNRVSGGSSRGNLSASQCKQVALGFTMAQDPGFGAQGWPIPSSVLTDSRNGTANELARLGGIFHSTPAVSSPPSALLRDDSYGAFRGTYGNRKTMLYVESTDGILHAYATPNSATTAQSAALSANFESFAFIPPMVMPKMLANYPGGQRNLLDGSPVVKDVIYSRGGGSVVASSNWHTVLLGSCGQGGCGGYFALDVTTPDLTTGGVSFTAAAPNPGTPPPTATGATASPHFLWQLTSIPSDGTAQGVQSTIHPTDNSSPPVVQYTLFGRETATPALTTVGITTASGFQEVGVAILPGGIDGGALGVTETATARTDGTGVYCKRASVLFSAPASYNTPRSWWDFSPAGLSGVGYTARQLVRKWGKSCDDPVPGRSVSVVRIDTGEIIRVFARNEGTSPAAYAEAPHALTSRNRVNNTPLDSPMIGTPVVYPSEAGSVARQFYVGDADGTMWKFDISDSNPDNWKGGIYYDVYHKEAVEADGPRTSPPISMNSDSLRAEAAQPIALLPNLALDQNGDLVLYVATGDPENFVSRHFVSGDVENKNEAAKVPLVNYLVAIKEKLGTDNKMHAFNIANISSPQPTDSWRHFMPYGERLAGPFVVFDRNIYYVTWKPAVNATCGTRVGDSVLYSRDYLAAQGSCARSGGNGCGGAAAGAPFSSCSPAASPTLPPDGGGCIALDGAAPLVDRDADPTGRLVPGVFLQATPACATAAAPAADAYTGKASSSTTGVSGGNYSLRLPIGNGATGSGSAGSGALTLSAPKTPTRVDAWATVVD